MHRAAPATFRMFTKQLPPCFEYAQTSTWPLHDVAIETRRNKICQTEKQSVVSKPQSTNGNKSRMVVGVPPAAFQRNKGTYTEQNTSMKMNARMFLKPSVSKKTSKTNKKSLKGLSSENLTGVKVISIDRSSFRIEPLIFLL
jgi:hypothetical protein